MRPTVALLLMVGLLLGPGYYAYCLYLSGRTSQTVEMTERASRWVTPDGSILRFADGVAYKPVVLTLTPGMNRVALRLHFSFGDKTIGRENETVRRYQASLAQFDHTILERPITLDARRPGTQSVDVGPMEIPYPADYLFVLEETGDVQSAPTVSLEVMENVETPNRTVVWTGMVLLIVAAIVTVRDLVVTARGRRPG
ncbi:MAG: hypothetical protein AMJ66_03985 [Betaproteobacteria bacterium SG8_40]|jgi:hypothetical protein|nr:MAG: hypothetical protein AMJ66_03985 [Betaproteobacteria bacterium SG8_40]